LLCNSQIPLRYLVTGRSEAGRRPAASWNLACHLARYSSLVTDLVAHASSLLASLAAS